MKRAIVQFISRVFGIRLLLGYHSTVDSSITLLTLPKKPDYATYDMTQPLFYRIPRNIGVFEIVSIQKRWFKEPRLTLRNVITESLVTLDQEAFEAIFIPSTLRIKFTSPKPSHKGPSHA